MTHMYPYCTRTERLVHTQCMYLGRTSLTSAPDERPQQTYSLHLATTWWQY